MSLRVWLPLNGTLDNQGLDDVVVTNNGATVDNNGKIGKCYSFDGNSSGININGNIISTLAQGDFSICFWIYNDDQGNRSIYIATVPSSGYAFAIQKTTGEGLRVYWQSSPDYYPTNFTVPVQEWCHITVVIKNNNCYCYKNGILVTSREDSSFTPQKLTNTWVYGMLGRDSRTGTTVLKGKINDFRWYNHALSPLEVKQISQGLILHYPLNRNGWGQENLLLNSNIEKSGTSNVAQWFRWNIANSPLVTNQYYTLSFDAKITVPTDVFYIGFARNDSTQEVLQQEVQVISEYKRYIFTGKTTKTNINSILISNCKSYGRGNGNNTTGTLYIKNIKLELGQKATFWCPNSSDELATILGLNDNIQYDTSGYGNNGIKIGTFSYDTDTPKYLCSTYFENYTKYISCGMTSRIPDAITMSCWIKGINKSARGGYHIPLNMHSTNYEISITSSSGKARMGYVVDGSRYVSDIGPDILDGKWHMLTSTFNGSTICRYIDGVLINSENRSGVLTSMDTLGVGAFPGGTTYGNTQLYESDVRIYCTALSAEDILSLYNNSAYIDNQGNIYGVVYEEV